MYLLLTKVKKIELMPITGILLRMKVGPLAFLVANCFKSIRIFENHTSKYFHVVAAHNSSKM